MIAPLLLALVLLCLHSCQCLIIGAARSRPSSAVLSGLGFGGTGKSRNERDRASAASASLFVPPEIARPKYVLQKAKEKGRVGRRPLWSGPATPDVAERMRKVCRLAREVLDVAVAAVQAGRSTADIDRIVHDATIERNSYPSTLGYQKFPKSCCTSVNSVMCHGIPDYATVLKDGDVINVDVTLFHGGVHGDCSETVIVGAAARQEDRNLVHCAAEALEKAIRICRPGVPYNAIGGVVEDFVASKSFSVVRDFAGHGISTEFHMEPTVLHYRNSMQLGVMTVGDTFTIEPIVCMGSSRYRTLPDGWTVVTADGLPAAQFEHTLLVTEGGVEVLTRKLPTSPRY